jgi:multiple antibiotic resistance protein
MFTTLLAIINPLEAIPVFLGLMQGKNSEEQNRVARKSCFYALLLAFFFLLFGTLMLRLFGVPLSMVRVVGGIILTRIGFQMFSPSPQGKGTPGSGDGTGAKGEGVAFIPLAMPIMFGPGAIATIIGMVSTVKQSSEELASFAAICLAIVATMTVTYLSLVYSKVILKKVGPKGIDRCCHAHCRFFRIRHRDGPHLSRDGGISPIVWGRWRQGCQYFLTL